MRWGFRAACLLVLTAAIGWLALGFVAKPWLINPSGGSYAVFDDDGGLLRLTLASDDRYRLFTPLERIPHALRQATLVQEDRYFYYHPGVNPWSLIRAALATYAVGERRVGGSTLSMQLARQRFLVSSRSVQGKLKQIYYALLIERHYSKDEILEAYLNSVPYGSNIEGVGAASLVYFGTRVTNLSFPEMLSLAVIPQSPAARTPFSDAGRAEMNRARERLAMLWHAEVGEVPQSARMELNVSTRRELPLRAPHMVDRMRSVGRRPGEIDSTIDASVQLIVERQLNQFVTRNARLGIRNGAVIVVDYRTMAVRAYVGSADWLGAEIQGQVNGLRGKRSPGSTLKPFIYGLAIDQGLIQPETMLKDTALRISSYNPENFERDFLGPLSATEALVRSRNVPAIALANQLEHPNLYATLRTAGVSRMRSEVHYGLSVALGGVELTMEELVELYAALANAGVKRSLRFERSTPAEPGTRLLSGEAAYMVLDMLRKNPRPSFDFGPVVPPSVTQIPWKTGTSYGFRDAWAIGIAGPYALGVWIGNFDGTPNPNFIGRDAAGPLFFAIVDALRTHEILSEAITHGPLNVRKVSVCAVSGALPGPHCNRVKETWFIPGVSPIKRCAIHRELAIDPKTGLRACPGEDGGSRREVFEVWTSDLLRLFRAAGVGRRTPPPYPPDCRVAGRTGQPPLITSPQAKITYTVRRGTPAEVTFNAVTEGDSKEVYWFVDDTYVGSSQSGESFQWDARPGAYVVRAVDDHGRSNSQALSVEQLPG